MDFADSAIPKTEELDEKCKSCFYEYPSLSCVNCGSKHRNYLSRNEMSKDYRIVEIPNGKSCLSIVEDWMCPLLDTEFCKCRLYRDNIQHFYKEGNSTFRFGKCQKCLTDDEMG